MDLQNEVTRILAKARFKYRSDTLENWEKENPVLLSGEIGVVIDGSETEKAKWGDGKTPWNNLGWWKGPKGEKGDKGEKGEKGFSGVYVGSGEMPDGYNIQINPDALEDTEEELTVLNALSKETLDKARIATDAAEKIIEEAETAIMAANCAVDLANNSAILKGAAEGEKSLVIRDVSPAEHLMSVTFPAEVLEEENPKLAVYGSSENDKYEEYSIKSSGSISAPFTILYAACNGENLKKYTSRHYQIFAAKERENLFNNPDWTYEYKYEGTDEDFADNGLAHLYTVDDENVKDINYIAFRFYHRPYKGICVHCSEMAVYKGKFLNNTNQPYILQQYPPSLKTAYGDNILSKANATSYSHWDERIDENSYEPIHPTIPLDAGFWDNAVAHVWFNDTSKMLSTAPNDLEQKEAYIGVELSLSDTVKNIKSIAPVMHMNLLGIDYSKDYPNFKVSYNRDINSAFEEIKNAIISLGGNV
jgi:hypothetical protein